MFLTRIDRGRIPEMRYSSNLTWYLKIPPSQTSAKFSVWSETNNLYIQITQRFEKLRFWEGVGNPWLKFLRLAESRAWPTTQCSAAAWFTPPELGSFQIISFSLWFFGTILDHIISRSLMRLKLFSRWFRLSKHKSPYGFSFQYSGFIRVSLS